MSLFTYTELTLKALLNELDPVRAIWFKIGLELDIPHTELMCFRTTYSDFSDAMCEMLIYWLKTNVDPSWKAVVTALRSCLVNEKNLAAQLESKYCTPTREESNSPITKMKKNEGITGFYY